jgi:tRNA threonylcarbamoyladenosine biosynthesis protein TsaE
MSRQFPVPGRFTFRTLDEFEAYAGQFARGLVAGDVVALSGELGSGKTTFVRAAVSARHREDQTTSPTFTFRHRYAGKPPIEHLDLYRIESASELCELGLEEAFEDGAIVFVEWWSHAPELLPRRRYELTIEGSGNDARTVTVTKNA